MMDAVPSGSDAGPYTLSFDVGGSNLKAGRLDAAGAFASERVRVPTPRPSPPGAVLDLLVGLGEGLRPFDRISVGFPGVVRAGVVLTAPNLGTPAWRGFDLAGALRARLGAPVRMLNDATVQGLGVIAGRGVECVITLGTGFGFSLYNNGRLGPHLEVGQHIARGDRTYDRYVGAAALAEVGRKRWRRRVRRAIEQIAVLTNYDALYIGGGNARLLDFELPPGVRLVSNKAGVTGGVRLWDSALDAAFAPARDGASGGEAEAGGTSAGAPGDHDGAAGDAVSVVPT